MRYKFSWNKAWTSAILICLFTAFTIFRFSCNGNRFHSKSWKQFYRILGDSRDTDADTVAYSILGVRPDQTDTLLVSSTNAKTVDLSFIDAMNEIYICLFA